MVDVKKIFHTAEVETCMLYEYNLVEFKHEESSG